MNNAKNRQNRDRKIPKVANCLKIADSHSTPACFVQTRTSPLWSHDAIISLKDKIILNLWGLKIRYEFFMTPKFFLSDCREVRIKPCDKFWEIHLQIKTRDFLPVQTSRWGPGYWSDPICMTFQLFFSFPISVTY